MKYTTIYYEGNKIEIFNSILGKETIKVNDEIVSSKYSLLGTEHRFELNNDSSIYRITLGYGLNGIVFSFYKDDRPIVESSKEGCWIWVAVGVFVGIVLYFLIKNF
ncbi:hypothetical protein LJC16_00275 [Bacteroidales bacterium OttesenSCG-928-C19]|nr:hypothetical protein [Bacteroidales bacterium OttesenSCG-928-C19]